MRRVLVVLVLVALFSCEEAEKEKMLIASFGVSNTAIYLGDSIFFNNYSEGRITETAWAFNGGRPRFWNGVVPPYIKYDSVGSFLVELYVGNEREHDIETKVGYITVLDTAITCSGTTVKDIDNNAYQVVRIGNQCWMASNLRVTRYNDGSTIATDLDNSTWENTTAGAYAIYDDNPLNEGIYGKLYNRYAASRDICPLGYHIPNKEDFDKLFDYLGIDTGGGALKSLNLWNSPNTGATNSTGFAALPAGHRLNTGQYFALGTNARFWSKGLTVDDVSYSLNLVYISSSYSYEFGDKNGGLSCRCLKD